MSASGSIFSGSSRYSTDFQQIINRSVAIASLSMTQMQTAKVALGDQSAALVAMDAKFSSLQSAIASLGSAAATYNSAVSDGSVAGASAGTGAFQGVYSLEVVDIGSYTSVMSKDAGLLKVTDPSTTSISTSADFTLTVGGVAQPLITPAANTLTDLANAINASGAGVEATIVNLGTSATPDYRLSLASTKLGAVSVELTDGTTDLLGTPSAGTLASYRVNGQPTVAIESDSRSVTIAPGLPATLLKAGTAQITVSHNTSGVGGTLSSIAKAYNAAVDEIDKYHAEGGSKALRGSSMLYVLSQSLRDIAGYSSGSGPISSLSSLGLGFDDKGKLSLDQAVFSAATDGQFQALSDFLGSSSTGGFMKYASDVMAGLEDTTNGAIKTAISGIQAQLTQQDSRIAEEQTRIDALQKNLEARMAASDALIASMEQQVNFMNGLMESMLVNQRNYY
ncbi:MAG: flagellar filament capping protein FliD [Bryobacterales bacterium]|nr:flagellar filament capping protein FliD [Bryobacterales bacterium]